jgi:hypothetical protein
MAVQTINYANKIDLSTTSTPAANKVSASDMNEIKTVVNNNAGLMHPVGSLLYTNNSTNPGSSLGGTWASVPCNEIIESGTIAGVNIDKATYCIYADGNFEIYGFSNAHDIGASNSFTIEFLFPYTFNNVVVINTLAGGGNNFASTNRYAYGDTVNHKIIMYAYNNSGSIASSVREAFYCKGTMDLDANNISTIYCWKRTS